MTVPGAYATVSQSTYRPQLAAGAVGMVADEAGAEIATRQVLTSGGIGFGLAVGQSVTSVKGVELGTANSAVFLGISVRDVTLDRMPIDPLTGTEVAADTYPQYSNMAVLTRGHIWVLAMANAAAGDPLYFDGSAGTFSNHTSSAQVANGYVVFTSQPVAGQVVTLDGTAITFETSGAVAASSQVNIGPTLGDTIVALAALINASADNGVGNFKAAAYPPSPGGAGEGSGANTLLLAAKVAGIGGATAGTGSTATGNSCTVTTDVTGATASGATLSGGTAAGVAVTGGFWIDSAISGQMARVSLGVQR